MERFNVSILENLHLDMAKKIVKDFKLPFNFVDKPHFVDIMGSIPEVAPEFNDAFDTIADICIHVNIDDQPQMIKMIHQTLDGMVDFILNSPGYPAFNGINGKMDINTMFPLEKSNVPTGDNYNTPSAGKDYISIDLKNAAFQAMKLWDTCYGKEYGCILGWDIHTYEDFVLEVMQRITFDNPYNKDMFDVVYRYVCKCKSLRQVIFGKTNPKRIMHIEKFIMQSVMKLISNDERFNIEPIRFNNDELIYEYNEDLDEKLGFPDSLGQLQWAITTIDKTNNNDMTKYISMTLDFHKKVYTLKEYAVKQSYMIVGGLKPIKFYVKQNREPYTHKPLAPEFKSLPSTVYLVARSLYESKFEEARYFETLPIMVDGVLHWMAIPTTNYSSDGEPVRRQNVWELIDPSKPAEENS